MPPCLVINYEFTIQYEIFYYVSTVNTLIQVATLIMKSRVQNWCQQGPWNVWIFANHSFNVITRLQKRIVINRTRTALLQSLFITWGRDVVSFIYGNTGCGVSSLEIQTPIDCFLKVKRFKGYFDFFFEIERWKAYGIWDRFSR